MLLMNSLFADKIMQFVGNLCLSYLVLYQRCEFHSDI